MKKYYAILILVIGSVFSATAQQKKLPPPIDGYKYISIDDAEHDFGEINYGTAVEYPVTMVNISKDTVDLSNVVVSCGCTTPQYTKGKYAPGDTIRMNVGFNGHADWLFNKTLSLLFQCPEGQFVKILRFKGKGIIKQ